MGPLSEEGLEGTRTGFPHVCEDELMRRETCMAGTLAGAQEQESALPWKRGQATQMDYNDVLGHCREKIRRPNPSWNLVWLLL